VHQRTAYRDRSATLPTHEASVAVTHSKQTAEVLSVTVVPGGSVVEIEVSRCTQQGGYIIYKPGQYVLINVRCGSASNSWQWHPFSVSSHPAQR
jgi:ferredoxin-NADP reductase